MVKTQEIDFMDSFYENSIQRYTELRLKLYHEELFETYRVIVSLIYRLKSNELINVEDVKKSIDVLESEFSQKKYEKVIENIKQKYQSIFTNDEIANFERKIRRKYFETKKTKTGFTKNVIKNITRPFLDDALNYIGKIELICEFEPKWKQYNLTGIKEKQECLAKL